MSTKQQLLKQHGLPSLCISAMVLTGFLLHNNDGTGKMNVNCDTFELLREAPVEDLPRGLEELTSVLSIVMPILPILVDSRELNWGDFKIEMIKSHILGQSSSFGMLEIARQFATFPDATFYKKCNISYFECQQKIDLVNVTLLWDHSFCNNATNKIDLMSSFVHFPSSSSTLVGASMASFIAILIYWHHITKHNKSLYHTSSPKKYFLYICISSMFIVFLVYCLYMYKTFNSIELYAIFSGAFFQVLIILALLRQDGK